MFMEEETIGERVEKKTVAQSFWELVRFALIAIIIVVPIRMFIAEPFVVSGSSMSPTFEDANYLIVDKLSYKMSNPERDDVVIFRYPKDQEKLFIKRVIGLPNETVDINGSSVTITKKNSKESLTLIEPYVKNSANNTTHIELKDDEYFVLGDNRSGSSDSRYWGAVKRKLMVGRVLLRLLPINKISVFPGYYKQREEK